MGNPKILIVDDEPFNIDYLEQELEESDVDTISATDGMEALRKVESELPDLVLLDIMMPVMDGFEVLSRMKANPATRDIPVIVISASNQLQFVVRGIQLGAEDYLPKPFEPTLLHARITSSLEKKRLRDLQQLYLKSLERELEIGREIQQGFLPSELPRASGWEIAVGFRAAREVSGDFYDAFLLPDGSLACVVGDVCGKGVGAALFMTLFRSLIRATLTTDYFRIALETRPLDPSERLQHAVSFTNEYIAITHNDTSMFATLFVGILSCEGGKLTYINCGSQPPFLVKNGGMATQLPPTGPVVGLLEDARFRVAEVYLDRDDLLLAFTDGIPDALNEDNVAFGDARIPEIITSNGSTVAVLVKSIEDALYQFIGDAQQFDDITMLAIQRRDCGAV